VSGPAHPFRSAGAGGGRPWIIAHRGHSVAAPENTLEAAQKGWEAGADAWEFDVRTTRDGVPVVLHDASLVRTTDVALRFARDPRGASGYLVADYDLDEVRTLDAGGWFLDPAGPPRSATWFGSTDRLSDADRALFGSGQVRIPTLAEALELTVRLGWPANVELKTTSADDPALLDRLFALIDEARAGPLVEVSSFDHADVARVARRLLDIATGVLIASPLYRPASYVREAVGADAYHPSAAALGSESIAYRKARSPFGLRADDLAELRTAGVPVFVFTVNDAAEGGLADHLAALGVSGLFTDDPAALVARWGHARDSRP
jgi:glycerophosphoryl diester phosphodiesterase